MGKGSIDYAAMIDQLLDEICKKIGTLSDAELGGLVHIICCYMKLAHSSNEGNPKAEDVRLGRFFRRAVVDREPNSLSLALSGHDGSRQELVTTLIADAVKRKERTDLEEAFRRIPATS